MARRANQGVGSPDLVSHHGVDRGKHAPGGEAGDTVAATANRGTMPGITTGSGDAGDVGEVSAGVNGGEFLIGREPGLDAEEVIGQTVEIEEMFGAADEFGTRNVGDRIGEGKRIAVFNQRESRVMGEKAVVKDETDTGGITR